MKTPLATPRAPDSRIYSNAEFCQVKQHMFVDLGELDACSKDAVTMWGYTQSRTGSERLGLIVLNVHGLRILEQFEKPYF